MVIGVLSISLVLHDVRSLKGKRQVIKSLTGKVKNRFNVSVAEVGSNDSWQSAELGIAAVGNDRAFVNSVLDKVANYVIGLHTAEVTSDEIEIMNF